tara:strand:- start:282 stop:686 length:405 start_codon:yes stop_codon:yes gene_type:complete
LENEFTTLSLDELFMEAAETERKLPPATRKAMLSSWVDYDPGWSAYGYTVLTPTKLKANAQEISRLDQALELGLMLTSEERRIVWAVAHSAAFRDRGPAWSKIARLLHMKDPRIIKRRYLDIMVRLYFRLKARS